MLGELLPLSRNQRQRARLGLYVLRVHLVCPVGCSGDPAVCTQDSATLNLAACLLEDRDIDYSLLKLNDHNCTGRLDQETHMVTFSFNSSDTCGAEVTVGALLHSDW